MTTDSHPETLPAEQLATRPGREVDMQQKPTVELESHVGTKKLEGKIALITGGDSGIGRAVALAFAKEGAAVAVSYLEEHDDAEMTRQIVEAEGVPCLLLPGDIGDEAFCKKIITQATTELGGLDILINNAAEQHPLDSISELTSEQLERTFKTNIFSMFYLTKHALPHLKRGSTIINTTSVTAYKGSPQLLDYSSTKGAIVAFTRSLSMALAEQGIRVNAVAPGPVWTPLIPSTFPPDKVAEFGQDVPLGRPGQPDEMALSYVFLASEDSSYMSGQTLHPNGGTVVNG